MSSKAFGLILVFTTLLVLLTGCSSRNAKENFSDRGRYIYDEADRLKQEPEISLASYLWRLDSRTDYEIVLVFPKDVMDEDSIIKWFNDHGVGKKGRDNGAAVFVFPDNSVFVAIGSGNDKVSVTYSKTHGERIFQKFNDDPVLTLLRFVSAVGGKVDESLETEIGGRLFDGLKVNLNLILLWAAVIALLFFLVQQVNGFQPHDLILPVAVFVVLGIFFGFSAIGSGSGSRTYQTYGVITSAKHGSYPWTHTHTICTSTGKTTVCTSYPHPHTMYTNDVVFQSYEFKNYGYRFQTDEYPGAWKHGVGELDGLSIQMKTGNLNGVSGISDNSGGKTIGDGVWIGSAKKR